MEIRESATFGPQVRFPEDRRQHRRVDRRPALVAPGPCITRACIEVSFDHTCMCLFREHDPIDLRCSSHIRHSMFRIVHLAWLLPPLSVRPGLAPGVHRVAVERGHQQLPLAPKPRGTKPGSECTSVPTARRTAVGRHGTAARVRHSYWNSIW